MLENSIEFFQNWRDSFQYISGLSEKYQKQKIIKVNALDNSLPVNQINTLTIIKDGLKEVSRLGLINFNVQSTDTCILESDFHTLRSYCYNPNPEEFERAYNKAILVNQYKFADHGYNNHNYKSKVKVRIKAYKFRDFKRREPKQRNPKLSKIEKERIKTEELEYKTKILHEIGSCIKFNIQF